MYSTSVKMIWISLGWMLGIPLLAVGAGDVVSAVPVQMSNTGEILFDQAKGSVEMDGDVEVVQAPFTFFADRVTWDMHTGLLQAYGDTRLMMDVSSDTEAALLERVEILRATGLTFDTIRNILSSRGLAEIHYGGARMVGWDFEVDLANQRVSAEQFRAGFGVFFMEGESLLAEEEELFVRQARFVVGEPESLSLGGSARAIEKQSDGSVLMKGVWLRVGKVPFFYWPRFRYDPVEQPFGITGTAGFSGSLGAYVRLRPSWQITEPMRAHLDAHAYSERGLLVGPGLRYLSRGQRHDLLQMNLRTGFISDQGDRGFDFEDQAIDFSRYFVDYSGVFGMGERLYVAGQLQLWSDSEVVRDFNSSLFRSIQQPSNWIEASWVEGHLGFVLGASYQYNAFEFATERLPDLSIHLLPSPVFGSGLYHGGSMGAVLLRDRDPSLELDVEYWRYRAQYHWLYPISLMHWLDWIPTATFQNLHYQNRGALEGSFSRTQFQWGFDLNAHAHRSWEFENAVWNLSGVRHIVTPTVRLRGLHQTGEPSGYWLPIEREIFSSGISDLDLSSHTMLDGIGQRTVIRAGVENAWMGRRKVDGSFYTMAGWDVFHDWELISGEPDRSYVSMQARMQPASWIRLELLSRVDSRSMTLNSHFARLKLVDGDIWDLAFSSQFMKGRVDQYQMLFRYKALEHLRLVAELAFDADRSILYEQVYGVEIAANPYWDLFLSVRTRSGSTRNNDTRFEVQIRPARF